MVQCYNVILGPSSIGGSSLDALRAHAAQAAANLQQQQVLLTFFSFRQCEIYVFVFVASNAKLHASA